MISEQNFESIQGLTLINNFITDELSNNIIKELDNKQWDNTTLCRRTQHYNYRYPYNNSYKLIHVNSDEGKNQKYLYDLNDTIYLKNINELLKEKINFDFDQCIVNEYNKDNVISKHIDNVKMFDDIIISISLIEPTLMRFINVKNKDIKKDIILPPNSLLIMKNDARYKYKHEIPKRKTFKYLNKLYRKNNDYRRVSLTFRKVKIN